MPETKDEYQVTLEVPADQEMMLVVRMMLAGLSTLCGLDMDQLDDLRTAADEACFCLMNQAQPVRQLRIDCIQSKTHLRVTMTAERVSDAMPCGQTHDPELARGILATLVPNVELISDTCGVHAIVLDIDAA